MEMKLYFESLGKLQQIIVVCHSQRLDFLFQAYRWLASLCAKQFTQSSATVPEAAFSRIPAYEASIFVLI